MSGQKFIRDVVLRTVVGEISELKIEFDVKKTLDSNSNEATIRVWNLSDSSRSNINEELADITVEAGYEREGSRGIIFKGFTRDVVHERIGPDIVTTIEAGDGDKAARKSHASVTYPKGTDLRTMILDLQSKMTDVELGEIKLPDDLTIPARPISFMAPPRRAMDELGRSFGFYWSVQNGALEVIPTDGFLSEVIEITPSTGMVGVPSITDSGILVQCLLNPSIRPNRQVYVQSETTGRIGADGLYRVSSVGYTGNNIDGEFICEIEAELINGGKTVVK